MGSILISFPSDFWDEVSKLVIFKAFSNFDVLTFLDQLIDMLIVMSRLERLL